MMTAVKVPSLFGRALTFSTVVSTSLPLKFTSCSQSPDHKVKSCQTCMRQGGSATSTCSFVRWPADFRRTKKLLSVRALTGDASRSRMILLLQHRSSCCVVLRRLLFHIVRLEPRQVRVLP